MLPAPPAGARCIRTRQGPFVRLDFQHDTRRPLFAGARQRLATLGRSGPLALHPPRCRAGDGGMEARASVRAGERDGRAPRLFRALHPAVLRFRPDRRRALRLGAVRRAPLSGHDRSRREAAVADLPRRPGRWARDFDAGLRGDRPRRRVQRGRALPGLGVGARDASDRDSPRRLRRPVERRGDPLPRLVDVRDRAEAQRRSRGRADFDGVHAAALQPGPAVGSHAGKLSLLPLRLRLGAAQRQHLGRHGLACRLELADRCRLRAADHRSRGPRAGAAGEIDAGRTGGPHRRHPGARGELSLHGLLRHCLGAALLEPLPARCGAPARTEAARREPARRACVSGS